jgi:lipoprotein-anchoring transpeptidase ErfK/SrfK
MRRLAGERAAKKLANAAVTGALLLVSSGVAAAQAGPAPAASNEPVVVQPAVRRIVVSIPDRKLALIADGRIVKVYPIAVGASSSPSPTGQFQIVNRLTDPTYYSPGVEIPAGKNNPLGTRWMGLSQKRFGIHGTNEPKSIGRSASHGCIRMRNADAEELFELVRVGDSVEVIGERTVELAAIFGAPEPVVPTAKPAAPVAPVVVAAVAMP